MKYAEIVKAHSEGLAVISKFLLKLDDVKVKKSTKRGCDIDFSFGAKQRIGSFKVIVGQHKSENVFVETFVTKLPANTDGRALVQRSGCLYSSQADFLFFLNGSLLCIVPLKSFRNWVDRNAISFRSGCEIYWWNGQEIRRHGLLIPIDRIRRDFAKGNVHVSIYRLKDNPNSDTDIEFVQEL